MPVPTPLLFDPLLGPLFAADTENGGFDVWTSASRPAAPVVRVLVLGDETTAATPDAWWRRFASRLADRLGARVVLHVGAGPGQDGARHLARIVRDAPGLRPDWIVALSGVAEETDAGPTPFGGPLTDALIRFLRENGAISLVNLGVEDAATPSDRFLRHRRWSALAAAELGAHFLVALRPAPSIDGPDPFAAAVRAAVRAHPEDHTHLLDLRDLGRDGDGVFDDRGRPTAIGAARIGDAMADAILARTPTVPIVAPPLPAIDPVAARRRRPAPPREPRLRIATFGTRPIRSRTGLPAALEASGRFLEVIDRSQPGSGVAATADDREAFDFAGLDAAIFDFGPIDEVSLRLGADLATARNHLLDVVDRATRAGCRPIVVVSPMSNRFRVARPLRAVCLDELRPAGVPVLDLYALIEAAAGVGGADPRDFFAEPARLLPAVETMIGRFLADAIVDLCGEDLAPAQETAGLPLHPTRRLSIADLAFDGEVEQVEIDDGLARAVRPTDGAGLRFAGASDVVVSAVEVDPGGSGDILDADGETILESRAPPSRHASRAGAVRCLSVRGRPTFGHDRPLRIRTVPGAGEDLLVHAVIIEETATRLFTGRPPSGREAIEARADADLLAALAAARDADPPAPADAVPQPPAAEPPPPPPRVDAKRPAFDLRDLFRRIGAVVRFWRGKRPSTAATTAVGVFDPLLGRVNARAGHAHHRDGYKIWPDPALAAKARFRIMTIGNSTSLWPAYPWSRFLGERLHLQRRPVAIWNGAGKGHSSSQEVLRVMRDAPGIRPDLIIALSGICDIGYLVNAERHPFLHKYGRDLIELVTRTGHAAATNPGFPDPASPAEVWCRNQRLARLFAADLGIGYLTLLQPVMGYGRHRRTPEEDELFAQKAAVVLRIYDRPYGHALTSFYDEVRAILAAEPERHAHVVDIVDVFADAEKVYKDHRHQTEAGCRILAAAIEEIVLARFDPPRSATPAPATSGVAGSGIAAAVGEGSRDGLSRPGTELPTLRNDPVRPMRIVVTGTSNSLMTSGYTNPFATDRRVAVFANHSLGASGTVTVGFHLPAIDFSAYDLCIVEYCVNEEVLLSMKQTSLTETIGNMRAVVDRAARAGCRCLFLVLPSRNRFHFPRPFQTWLRTEMRTLGIPVFDTYALLQRVMNERSVAMPDFFLDRVHLKRNVARTIGRFLIRIAATILAEPKPGLVEDPSRRVRPIDLVAAADLVPGGGARRASKRSRLVSSDFVEMPVGSSVSFADPRGGEVTGVVFDAGASRGRLTVDDGSVLFATRDEPGAGRDGKLTLVCHPVATPLAYPPGGLTVTHTGDPGSDATMTVAAFVLRPALPDRPMAYLPGPATSTRIEEFATEKLIEEIAAATRS